MQTGSPADSMKKRRDVLFDEARVHQPEALPELASGLCGEEKTKRGLDISMGVGIMKEKVTTEYSEMNN